MRATLFIWKNKPIKSVKKTFAAPKRRAGITRRIRMYDFRHAFASTMLKKGGDLKPISEMLGHSRPDTTTNIYQHTDIAMHRKNIVLLPGLKLKNNHKKMKLAKNIISQNFFNYYKYLT